MHIIQKVDAESAKLVEAEGQEEEEEGKHNEEHKKTEVDSYKVEALSTMLDDFENIISKNFCLFSNYEDFSFAQSRSKEKLEE